MAKSAPVTKPKNTTATQSEPVDVMGIISLVLAFMGLSIPGLIIGIIGERNAKKEGRSPTLSKIAWIVNLIITVFTIIAIVIFIAFLLIIPSHVNKGDDLVRKVDLKAYSQKLENFHEVNGYYPPSLDEVVTDSSRLSDPDGKPYVYKASPDNCSKCTSFTLETTLENGNAVYTVKSSSY